MKYVSDLCGGPTEAQAKVPEAPYGATVRFEGHTLFKSIRFPSSATPVPVLLIPAARYPMDLIMVNIGTAGDSFTLTLAANAADARSSSANAFQLSFVYAAAPVTLRWPAKTPLWGAASSVVGVSAGISIAASELPEGAG